jgi:hypothetical protein
MVAHIKDTEDGSKKREDERAPAFLSFRTSVIYMHSGDSSLLVCAKKDEWSYPVNSLTDRASGIMPKHRNLIVSYTYLEPNSCCFTAPRSIIRTLSLSSAHSINGAGLCLLQ